MAVAVLVLPFWGSVQVSRKLSKEPEAKLAPYSYKYLYDEFRKGNKQNAAFIQNPETRQEISLYPYTHVNAECQLPLTKDEPVCYQLRNVRYRFQIIEDTFQVLSVEFYSQEHWRKLYEQDGKLYEEQLDGHWPFHRRNLVAELSERDGFYDPIPILRSGGCGVLLLSSDDPGVGSDIRVYIPTKKGWEQASFLMPEGTQQDHLQGYVHRREDHSARDAVNGEIGTMEVCTKNQDDVYILYQVVYSDGLLRLEDSEQGTVSAENLLNWTY